MVGERCEVLRVEGGSAVFDTQAGAPAGLNGMPLEGLEQGEADELARLLNGSTPDVRGQTVH